jgi:hypothetical protein
MLLCYIKEKKDRVYIYERGETYIGRTLKKVDRMFKDWNGEPLTFPDVETATQFCTSRNDIITHCTPF